MRQEIKTSNQNSAAPYETVASHTRQLNLTEGLARQSELIYLSDYWRIVRRWWAIPVLVIGTSVLLILTQSKRDTVTYEAYSTVQVDRKLNGKWAEILVRADDSPELNTLVNNLQSTEFVDRVAKALRLERDGKLLPADSDKSAGTSGLANTRGANEQEKLDDDIQALLSGVKITRIPGTRLIEIRFRHADGKTAEKIVNVWAKELIEDCQRNKNTTADRETALSNQPAKFSRDQSVTNNNSPQDIASGVGCRFEMNLASSASQAAAIVTRTRPNFLVLLFLSTIGGIGLTLVIDFLRNRIECVEDINRYLHLPVLGVIPVSLFKAGRSDAPSNTDSGTPLILVKEEKAGSLVKVHQNTESPALEAYRRLRATLLVTAAKPTPQALLVTSGDIAEGSTAVAINLAVLFAQTGARVLLIDCNFQQPQVHQAFGLNVEHGLSDYLSSSEEAQKYTRNISSNLSVMTAGSPLPNVHDLLSSANARQRLQLLEDSFDYLLIASPAVSTSADTLVLSALADSVILVAKAGNTSRKVARQSKSQLQAAGANILGAVLN